MKHGKSQLASTIVLASLLVSTTVQGADLLGLYVGAGGGRADLRGNSNTCSILDCSTATVAGWTAFAGIHPLPYLGAELQYLNFGRTNQGVAGINTYYQRTDALAVFATGTLPLHFVDLYAKLGAGRIRSRDSAVDVEPIECLFQICEIAEDRHANHLGWGLGARFNVPQLSSLALRAEYVRFRVPEGDPDLLSVALLCKF